MGPSHPPLADDIQFSMDFEDEAAGTGTTIAPRTFESEGASHKKADNALAPARSRSVGHSQRDSRRSSLDASAERAEKKPRISASGSAGCVSPCRPGSHSNPERRRLPSGGRPAAMFA
eukprot:scaffold234652_cov32-Tisochrysis_lutea.AAC.5